MRFGHVGKENGDALLKLFSQMDRRAFLTLVQRYQQRFGLRIYHYCLMSNHFHMLVHLSDPRHVSPLMAGLLRAYVHHCHRRHGFVGHRWQGRFKSPAVQCRQYLLSCGRYLERNPVEAGLLTEPWQYPWSSAAAYANPATKTATTNRPITWETVEGGQDGQPLYSPGAPPPVRQCNM